MRQRRKCIVLALVMALTLSNISVPQVEAKSKTPSVKKSITLTVGKKKTIKVTGSKIKSKKFLVTKGKKYISVSKKGTVKAKKRGTAKIKVTVKYKSGKKVKSKKLYVKVKVVNKVTNTTVTNKPSVTTKPSASSTAPSVTTSTPSAKPSEKPSAKPTETPSAEPTETPALDLNENGLVVKSGRLTSYSGSAKTLSIPEGVTEIAENALEDAEVKSIELPSTLQTIGARAFKGCSNLEDIDCPNTVVGVGDYACEDCTALESISIPNEEAEIGEAILEGCVNLTSAYIPAASGCSHEYMKIKIDANCTQNGTNIYICKDCGDIVNNTVNALGHDIEVVRIEPTCVKDGMEKKVCKRCNAIIDVITIDALGHDYKDEVTKPTCTEKGYTTHTCSRCDDSYKDSYVDALGHDYNSVVTDPTCTEKGYTTHTCSRCDSVVKDTYVDALGHDFIGWVTNIPATCTENGQQVGVCSRCSLESFRDLLATGHTYGTPVYEWSDDGSSCTATRTCENDSSHVETEEAVIKSSVETSATCENKGTTRYTATFENEAFDTQTKDIADIPATGHDWGTPTYTWSSDGKSCTAKRVCTKDSSHVETCSGTMSSKVKTAATCTTKGTTIYTANFSNTAFTTQTKDVQDINATGHSWCSPIYTWSSDGKTCTAKRVCSKNSSHTEIESAKITSAVKTAATCTTKGTTRYTAKFTNSAFSTHTKDVQDIAAKGHSKSYSVNIAYSGSEGNVRYLSIRCSRCNTTLSASEAYFTSGSEYSLGSYSEVPASYSQDGLVIYKEAESSSSTTSPAKSTQNYTYLRGFDNFDTKSNATGLANFLAYRLCSDSCGKTLLIDDIDGSKSTNIEFFSKLAEQGFKVIVLD